MPPKVFFPNFPLVLRLKAPARVFPPVKMPPAGTEGVFKTSELVFETIQQISKPQLFNFLTSVYGIDVKRINSLNVMGRRRNEMTKMPRQTKDFKRFYVKLHEAVELPNVPKALHLIKDATKK